MNSYYFKVNIQSASKPKYNYVHFKSTSLKQATSNLLFCMFSEVYDTRNVKSKRLATKAKRKLLSKHESKVEVCTEKDYKLNYKQND